tara:strand:+ start:1927 stop:2043 length:117 start_codon:yes stop_codon:yes gene_type:complete
MHPSKVVTKNSFGKIALRNGPAFSSRKILKTDGATIAD